MPSFSQPMSTRLPWFPLRDKPSILITGSRKSGKTEICKYIHQNYRKHYIWHDVRQYALDNNLTIANDVTPDRVLMADELVEETYHYMLSGGFVVEYDKSDIFPQEWFDAVFVITCDDKKIRDRLVENGCTDPFEIDNIVNGELFQRPYVEAVESYDWMVPIYKLKNNDSFQIAQNANKIFWFLDQFQYNNTDEETVV